MGLLYIMPATAEEVSHVKEESVNGERQIVISSYGLPYSFWGYFLIIVTFELFMYISISSILSKFLQSSVAFDQILGIVTIITLISIPLFCLAILFYQKQIIRKKKNIIVQSKIFGIRVRKKVYNYVPNETQLVVKHLLESPNMAKIHKKPNTRAFENQGHYILSLVAENKQVFLDRHTRRQDLEKLAKLIMSLD